MTSCYKIFSCPHCAKFTYAKVDQKFRICGVCNLKINVQAIINFESTQTVVQAHKLAQQKNVAWLRQKGIQLQPEPSPKCKKQGETSEKTNSPSHTHFIQDLITKVANMIRSKHIEDLQSVTDPYLQIFFQSAHPPAEITFAEFKRQFLTYIHTSGK
jgi:hypothetical protein